MPAPEPTRQPRSIRSPPAAIAAGLWELIGRGPPLVAGGYAVLDARPAPRAGVAGSRSRPSAGCGTAARRCGARRPRAAAATSPCRAGRTAGCACRWSRAPAAPTSTARLGLEPAGQAARLVLESLGTGACVGEDPVGLLLALRHELVGVLGGDLQQPGGRGRSLGDARRTGLRLSAAPAGCTGSCCSGTGCLA